MTKSADLLLPEQAAGRERGLCSWCGAVVRLEDFRDNLSIDEFYTSGFCQKCQDETWEDGK